MTSPAALLPLSPDATDAPAHAWVSLSVHRHDLAHGAVQHALDAIAVETPVALQYNGVSHATLLATPHDLVDLAYGFSYTEGLIRSAADIRAVDLSTVPNGQVIDLEVATACMQAMQKRRRQLAGRSGCGLCGLESLDAVVRQLPPVSARPAGWLAPGAIARAMGQLREGQPLHRHTGATHAAAWADTSGQLQCVREDVGRHNALDKLIGHLLRTRTDRSAGFVVVSSRASFEMVQKTASADIALLAAVSAPTSFAITLATQLGLTLLGFARDQRYTVYAGQAPS